MKNFAITPEKGAETIVYLASSDNVAKTTGLLLLISAKPFEPSKLAQGRRCGRAPVAANSENPPVSTNSYF